MSPGVIITAFVVSLLLVFGGKASDEAARRKKERKLSSLLGNTVRFFDFNDAKVQQVHGEIVELRENNRENLEGLERVVDDL